MDATFDGDLVRAGRDAREQFHDARGYGRPDDGGLVLAPVEAAHLLFRGDLDAVVDRGGGERLDFRSFLASTAVSEVAFLAYKDLRDRGFYLSPAREGWVDDPVGDFAVHPRGQGPWDGAVAYRVRVASERQPLRADALRDLAAVDAGGTAALAAIDEESDVSYFELSVPPIEGSTHHDFPPVAGDLLADRVLVWDPPPTLHDRTFFGQRLDGDGAVQLSLVEAAHLARRELLTLDATPAGTDATDAATAVVDRGRAVEGDRFDRRLRVYTALRDAGLVPKTGFKFGADFRTYADVDDVENLGHSESLVRVLPPDHAFAPRDLALDVRLAGGVRKRMTFALAGPDGIDWLSAARLTP